MTTACQHTPNRAILFVVDIDNDLKPEEEELMRQLAEQNYGHFVQK